MPRPPRYDVQAAPPREYDVAVHPPSASRWREEEQPAVQFKLGQERVLAGASHSEEGAIVKYHVVELLLVAGSEHHIPPLDFI